MKILLFGATGQLGQDIQKVFEGASITKFSSKEFDFSSTDKLVVNDQYDIIINAMAMTNTGLCEEQSSLAYKLNAERVGEISKLAAFMDAVLFHFSTDYVFDGLEKKKYTETDLPSPVSIYGASKLAGEFHAKMYHKKIFVFRVSSLFGVGGNNFVKVMLQKAKNGESLTVVDDQFMSPTHSLDVARVVKYFVDNKVEDYGVFHVSNQGVCSWFEFTKEILNIAGLNVELSPVSHTQFPAKLRRPEYSPLDISKISKYHQMPDWKVALGEFLGLLEK
ncbi:MAG: dTDP-4-dehydrorhamnose reductase [Deltaproteobacteria bacterium]|nr:MAG: dTDP-4-dehydrorhamnose reductase [Deltaproteobacteria bacterium]